MRYVFIEDILCRMYCLLMVCVYNMMVSVDRVCVYNMMVSVDRVCTYNMRYVCIYECSIQDAITYMHMHV